LNVITVTEDRKTVTVGTGLRWANVTRVLDSIGLAIVGGRVSDPGVGGLTLGGGISYFTGTHGFVCDNVRQYEIVIPSGQVVYANASNNADLFWALRGGT
jgi:FAD/FMN-containing dehydrogenase